MEILNVKIRKETMDKLEGLVRKKTFKNKSEAVRIMLEEHLKEHPELFSTAEFEGLLKEADKMSDRSFEKLAAKVFKGPKTAAQLVSEGRGR